MFTNLKVQSSRVFSLERPTPRDFDVWRTTLRSVTSADRTLEHPLGRYLTLPHNTDGWFATEDESTLIHKNNDGNVDVYSLPQQR